MYNILKTNKYTVYYNKYFILPLCDITLINNANSIII